VFGEQPPGAAGFGGGSQLNGEVGQTESEVIEQGGVRGQCLGGPTEEIGKRPSDGSRFVQAIAEELRIDQVGAKLVHRVTNELIDPGAERGIVRVKATPELLQQKQGIANHATSTGLFEVVEIRGPIPRESEEQPLIELIGALLADGLAGFLETGEFRVGDLGCGEDGLADLFGFDFDDDAWSGRGLEMRDIGGQFEAARGVGIGGGLQFRGEEGDAS